MSKKHQNGKSSDTFLTSLNLRSVTDSIRSKNQEVLCLANDIEPF